MNTYIVHSNRNFTDEFINNSTRNHYVETLTELNNVDVSKVARLLGLFSQTHTIYDYERRQKSVEMVPDSPSIVDMTKKAIEMLQKNTEQGFFLMVEGGRIDQAHHKSWVNMALDETVVMDEAIEAAYNMVDLDETLIIVTADHGHTMSHAGYPTRGSDIRRKIHEYSWFPGRY